MKKISSLANRMNRPDALADVRDKMVGIMKGKTMIVGFYIRGPIGSPVSNPALEITSSVYVSHSAEILYRNAYHAFDREVERTGHFFVNVHSEGLNRPEDLPNARVFMDRSFRTTFSFNCTYAGNTLLLKKGNHRFAVDKSVYENKGNETGRTHVSSQASKVPEAGQPGVREPPPADAAKPPPPWQDIFLWETTWRSSGSPRTAASGPVNPECGIFGIVEDVNWDGDPQLMQILRREGAEVIWSNVLIDDKRVPHWVGNGEDPPDKGTNFQGDWFKGKVDGNQKPVPMSHPNSRCTVASTAPGKLFRLCRRSGRCRNPYYYLQRP